MGLFSHRVFTFPSLEKIVARKPPKRSSRFLWIGKGRSVSPSGDVTPSNSPFKGLRTDTLAPLGAKCL